MPDLNCASLDLHVSWLLAVPAVGIDGGLFGARFGNRHVTAVFGTAERSMKSSSVGSGHVCSKAGTKMSRVAQEGANSGCMCMQILATLTFPSFAQGCGKPPCT